MSESNIGQTGVESIRLRGQKVEDLPLGTGNQALSELELARETERLVAIAEINKQYPSQRVDYLVARINECEENKNRMKALRTDILTRQQQYRDLVTRCDVRDRMLADHEKARSEVSEEYWEKRRREILKDWGRWDVDELHNQIKLDDESLERVEGVIGQEDDSIKEFTKVLTLCKERDRKLAEHGAKAEGS